MAPLIGARAAFIVAFLLAASLVAASGCGSGACRPSPCVPGVPLLQGTCKCVPPDDAGPTLDAGADTAS